MKVKTRVFHKTIAACMAVALSVGVFAGCGASTTTRKDDQGRIIVTVGNWATSEGKNMDNLNARKARYEEANTDAVIEPSTWKFDRSTFYAQASGGQLPTIYSVGYTEMKEIIDSEYASDLTSVLKKRGYEGRFNELPLSVVSDDDGKIYGIPNGAYILGMMYNVDMFKKAGLLNEDGTPMQPKDWYEVAEFAVKIKEATGKPGIVIPSASKYGGWLFTPIAWSFGVNFMEKDDNGKWVAKFNSPEMVEALQYIKDLKWKYDVLPTNSLIDSAEFFKTFATGGAGMIISDPSGAESLPKYDMKPSEFGMFAMPEGPKRHVTLIGGGAYCIRAGASDEEIDAALRWLEMQFTFDATDEYKQNSIADFEYRIKTGEQIGLRRLSAWSPDTPSLKWLEEERAKYTNVDEAQVKLFNEFSDNCPADIQTEEPVCAQELYSILDDCLQEVLSNKDADCASIVAKAASDFQVNYLDNVIE